MQLTLQKIYFVFAFSYIVYFFFTVNKYKYKVLTPGFRGTNIAGIVIIIFIIIFILLYGLKQKFVYVKSDGNTWNWETHNPNGNYLVKKKRDLIIREALHKTYKWREYFNGFLKLLQSSKSLSVVKARELVAFLYGSDFLRQEEITTDAETKIDPIIAPIIGLTNEGIIDPGFTEKTISDDNKKKLIGFLLKKIYDDESLTYESGKEYFKDLRKNLPKQVIIDRLRYFIEGRINEGGDELGLLPFDTVFSALGGRTVYTTELSEFNEPIRGGANRRTGSLSSLAGVDDMIQLGPGAPPISPASDAGSIRFIPETQTEPIIPQTSQPNIDVTQQIGETDAQSRPMGPAPPTRPTSINDGLRELQPPIPHFWGYGVTQNSLYTGNPLKKPLLKALDIIKTWIPVKYEFYDDDIPDDYIDSKGGGLRSALDIPMYNKGSIISSRGAGFLDPSRQPEDVTLNNLVNNNFRSGRIRSNLTEDEKEKYDNLNKLVDFLKNVISYIKNEDSVKDIKKNKIHTLVKKKLRGITDEEKKYLIYLIKKNVLEAPPRFEPIGEYGVEDDIQDDGSILSILKNTIDDNLSLQNIDPDLLLSNNHLTNYFKRILDRVRITYGEFTAPAEGYTNYPPWLKNNSLIKMKTHRDVAKNISEYFNQVVDEAQQTGSLPEVSDDQLERGILDEGNIMGNNKAAGLPPNKEPKEYILEKLKLYNVPTSNIQNGGAARPLSGAPATGSILEIPQGVTNWAHNEDNYNLTYDEVKEDINIDSLNKDPGEVSSKDKQKYSSTNYNYSKEISDFMLENDYYSEFLKFTVYFGNFSIFAILLSILSYLATYKGRVIKNTNVTNYDKNIFNDQINKQKKYIYIFITIFSLITIVSFKPLKKYTLLIVEIIKSLFSDAAAAASDAGGTQMGGADAAAGLGDAVAGPGDVPVPTIVDTIKNVFVNIKEFILNHKISLIITVLIICIIILLAIPSFVPKRKKKEYDITNLFVSDLKRSQKLKEGDPEPKPLYEKKGNYICYNNLCTNNSSSINNKKAQVKKYNGNENNIKKFKNLKECKSSGCETIGNSGIKAVKYSVTKI